MAATWTIEGETACLRQRDIFSNPPDSRGQHRHTTLYDARRTTVTGPSGPLGLGPHPIVAVMRVDAVLERGELAVGYRAPGANGMSVSG